jgi:hypothetical protein
MIDLALDPGQLKTLAGDAVVWSRSATRWLPSGQVEFSHVVLTARDLLVSLRERGAEGTLVMLTDADAAIQRWAREFVH